MRVSSPRSAPKPEPGVTLSPLPMAASSMMPGRLYIWHIESGDRHRVVRLHGDFGVKSLYDGDTWLFEHNLVGKLYGPITLLP